MALMDFIKKQFIDIIEWVEPADGTLAWRFPMADREIQNGGSLTVRESQMALFVNKGTVVGQIGPGQHKIDADELPFLGVFIDNLVAKNLYKAELYFVSTRDFVDEPFGGRIDDVFDPQTKQVVSLRVFGEYAMKVSDAASVVTKLVVEPRPGDRPLALDAGGRHAKRLRRLFDREPGEVPQHHHAGHALVLRLHATQRLVEGHEVDGIVDGVVDAGDVDLRERDRPLPAAVSLAAEPPGPLDQDPAHRQGRGPEEVSLVLPRRTAVTDEAKVDLMHESGRLKGLARSLAFQALRRQLPQLLIDQRQQLIGSVTVARSDRPEKPGDVATADRSVGLASVRSVSRGFVHGDRDRRGQ